MADISDPLDFNDAPTLRVIDPEEYERRLARLRGELATRADDLVRDLFPAAVVSAIEARVGNVDGEPGESLSIGLVGERRGLWFDHATSDGGDLIDLWQRATRSTDFLQVIDDLERWCGLSTAPRWTSRVTKVAEQRRNSAERAPAAPQAALGEPTGVWRYVDVDGVLVATVKRYDTAGGKKTYRPFLASGAAGMPDPRPLYRQADIAAADHVILVEGEKCADALAALGFVATTAMGGASANPTKTDWRPLAGKAVTIWPDNDDPGRKMPERLRPALEAVGARVTVLSPPAGKPEKWDAADAADEGFDVAGFIATATVKAAISATRYVWRDPATIPPREWLYGRHYIRRYSSGTVAPGGVGKSTLVLAEAIDMVTGKGLFGRGGDRLRVWCWNGEDGSEELHRRVQATCLAHGVTSEDLGDRLFMDSGRDLPLVLVSEVREGVKVAEPLIDALCATMISNRIDVLIVDPFVSCHEVSENDNSKIDKVVKAWNRVAERADVAIELVHHVRKVAAGNEVTIEDSRGAKALTDGLRMSRVLNPMSEDEAARYNIAPEDRTAYVKVAAGKVNLTPSTGKPTWRRLVSVSLGNATQTQPADEIGVAIPWEPEGPGQGLAIPEILQVQTVISNNDWRVDQRSPNWAGRAIGEALRFDVSRPEHVSRIKAIMRQLVADRWLVQVSKPDQNRKPKTYLEVGKWAE